MPCQRPHHRRHVGPVSGEAVAGSFPSPRRAALAGVLVLVAGGLHPRPARAYARATTPTGQPQHWDGGCPTFAVHLDELPGADPAATRAAAAAAASAWTAEAIDCTGLQIALDFQRGPGPASGNDGVNTIGARLDTWCSDGGGHAGAALAPPAPGCRNDPSELAWTAVFAAADSGRIQGADVQLNAVSFHWGDPAAAGGQGHAVDLQAALMHEIGHALGLAHPCRDLDEPASLDDQGQPLPDCYDAPDEVQASVMFPEVQRGSPVRTLSADDRRAICEMYPRQDDAAPVCAGAVRTAGGGCSAGGRARPGALPVAALAMLLSRRRQTRHSSRR